MSLLRRHFDDEPVKTAEDYQIEAAYGSRENYERWHPPERPPSPRQLREAEEREMRERAREAEARRREAEEAAKAEQAAAQHEANRRKSEYAVGLHETAARADRELGVARYELEQTVRSHNYDEALALGARIAALGEVRRMAEKLKAEAKANDPARWFLHGARA